MNNLQYTRVSAVTHKYPYGYTSNVPSSISGLSDAFEAQKAILGNNH